MNSNKLKFAIVLFLAFSISNFCFAQFSLQSSNSSANGKNQEKDDRPILIGQENGLFKLEKGSARDKNGKIINKTSCLWSEGAVKKIIYTTDGWFFLTSEGIVFSEDLIKFTKRNEGLPFHTIKKYDGTKKSFITMPKDLKDLAVHPETPQIMVTATKDSVYLSRNGGLSWVSIGLNARTTGVKCLCVMNVPLYDVRGEECGTELMVFLSHTIYGLSTYEPDSDSPKWIDIADGFSNIPGNSITEEIASLLPVKVKDSYKQTHYELYMGTTYIPRLYKFNFKLNEIETVWQDGVKNATQDSLVYLNGTLVSLGLDGFKCVDVETGKPVAAPEQVKEWNDIIEGCEQNVLSLFIPGKKLKRASSEDISLCELWMTKNGTIKSNYAEKIEGKKGIYVPANQAADERIENHLRTLKENKLNTIVVDMKDDAGLLRYDTQDPLVKKYSTKSIYSIKIDEFVPKLKKQGIYLIGRIVVFKDKNLYRVAGKKFAVWDRKTDAAWVGIRQNVDVLDEEGNPTGEKQAEYYDEYWVDPYNEEIWEYNIAIAKELIAKGFDEIQFDYIRFPTDGINLYDAKFRYQEKGMDKESALISFLSYARENIKAPIGIDIYGANGWYRSSARTGQDVELMSKFVDVISPMFYPNHFEQDFLAYSPEIERSYRIYYMGSYRNHLMGRDKILVRPWVQAFFMRVRQDVKYYDKNYVKREVYGVRDSINDGYLYWNNAGRYEDIDPDIGKEAYPWSNNLKAERNELNVDVRNEKSK